MTTHSAPTVRAVHEADLSAIQQIYAQHVMMGRASFESTPPTAAELAARWRAVTAKGLPYLAAEIDGAVVGFATDLGAAKAAVCGSRS